MKDKESPQESCEDCISRADAIEFFKDDDYVVNELKNLASVNPAEKVGHWIDHQEDRWIYAKCSECGTVHDSRTNYCPNCGAKMQEVE